MQAPIVQLLSANILFEECSTRELLNKLKNFKEPTMKKFTLAVLTLCLFAASAFAQGTQGRLVGTVAGPDGNIAGANVTAKDNQTGKEFTVQATADGTFSIPQLEVGTYTVTITAP